MPNVLFDTVQDHLKISDISKRKGCDKDIIEFIVLYHSQNSSCSILKVYHLKRMLYLYLPFRKLNEGIPCSYTCVIEALFTHFHSFC